MSFPRWEKTEGSGPGGDPRYRRYSGFRPPGPRVCLGPSAGVEEETLGPDRGVDRRRTAGGPRPTRGRDGPSPRDTPLFVGDYPDRGPRPPYVTREVPNLWVRPRDVLLLWGKDCAPVGCRPHPSCSQDTVLLRVRDKSPRVRCRHLLDSRGSSGSLGTLLIVLSLLLHPTCVSVGSYSLGSPCITISLTISLEGPDFYVGARCVVVKSVVTCHRGILML